MSPKRFYFAGHTHFGNRGCEALIRSTVQLLRQEFGEIEAWVPSAHPELDGAQWPQHRAEGVRFVPAPTFPETLRWWQRIVRAVPSLKAHWLPRVRASQEAEAPIADCDVILLTGGDVISLDYGLPSLIWNVRLVEPYVRAGKPAILWGASVGPFSKEPAIERFMSGFLQALSLVTSRESITTDYLRRLGLEANLHQVTDPAFTLQPEAHGCEFWPQTSPRGVLGFNVSPLIAKFRPAGESPNVLRSEIAAFLHHVVGEGFSVLLVPHVDPLDGAQHNSDSYYMSALLAEMGDCDGRIALVPRGLNAAQLKFVIARTTYFIGARTHATIAAMSCGVPTLSIAYSVKAKGLNRDLFGDERYVIDTPSVSAEQLKVKFAFLQADADHARAKLAQMLPLWRERAALPSKLLKSRLDHSATAALQTA
jgi:colanic acid/amylovoran biosynthesis protein